MTPEQISSLLTQLPMVAILMYIFMKQSEMHQKSIEYYRDRLDSILEWLMKQELKQEEKTERPS